MARGSRRRGASPRDVAPVRTHSKPTGPRRVTFAIAGLSLSLACGEPASGADDRGAPGGETTAPGAPDGDAFMRVAANASQTHVLQFNTGAGFFLQRWLVAPADSAARDGLGPLYAADTCASCHPGNGRGSPLSMPDAPDAPGVADAAAPALLLRLGIDGAGALGEPVPEPTYGAQLQPFAIPGVPAEGVVRASYVEREVTVDDGTRYVLAEPRYAIDALGYGPMSAALRVSPRVASAVVGLGLLEAIPEERLLELEDPDDADGDGISGRLNRVRDVTADAPAPGRFGWKAEQPSLRQQAASAFLFDIGMTTSLFAVDDCSPLEAECRAAPGGGAPELIDRALDRIELFLRLLAPAPRRAPGDPDVERGELAFAEAGCAGCHVPGHRTATDATLDELAGQQIWPYTDLLLHDLGEGLSDHRPTFGASGSEWRTPPLWGLGLYPTVNGHDRLLHDGRARGIAEAVLWHGGEAAGSRDAFAALDAAARAALIRFVASL